MRRFWALGVAGTLVSGVAAAQVPSSPDNDVAPRQHPAAAPSSAAGAAPERQTKPEANQLSFAFLFQTGVATPIGGIGVVGDLSPLPFLSLEAGVGSNGLGPQFSGLTRLRLPIGASDRSLFFGIGYSQGRHSQTAFNRDGAGSIFTGTLAGMGHSTPRGHSWDKAHWLNLELGVEEIRYYHLDLRFFVGMAALLNPDDGVVVAPTNTSEVLDVNGQLFYFGFAAGYSS